MVMFSVSPSFSQLLVENFDYPAGDTLTNHGWSNHSGIGTLITVSSGSLTYNDYSSSGIGNHVVIQGGGGSREDVNWGFTEQNQHGTSIYYSFLASVNFASTTADYFFHIGNRAAVDTFLQFSARVFVQAADTNIRFGLSNTSTPQMGTTNFKDSVTYLIVVKYTIDTTGNDTCSLWIFDDELPLIEADAGIPEVTNSITTGQNIIDAIGLRQGGTSLSIAVDGIRIGTSWGEAPIPVELTSFTATTQNNGVLLKWTTATELNNSGFEVERKQENSSWSKITFLQGNGTTSSQKEYSYFDGNLASGKYLYRLKQIDFDGSFEYSNIIEADVNVPTKFELSQNYPNPFNPYTVITYSLPKAGYVSLKVYNALGQEVSTLINGIKDAGIHKIDFNAAGLNSGIYFYKLESDNATQVKKMTLLK